MPSHTYITKSRTTPFQEEEDDVDIPQVTQDQASDTQATVLQGPITHSHTKKLQQKLYKERKQRIRTKWISSDKEDPASSVRTSSDKSVRTISSDMFGPS
jgi:hypothetical protein